MLARETLPIDWSKHRVWSAEAIIAERERLTDQVYGKWGRMIEIETRRRIHLCVATYAYEIADSPIMPDHTWDYLAQTINPKLGTCHPLIDEFFVVHFSPMTGMWIHHHPELEGIERIYKRHHAKR